MAKRGSYLGGSTVLNSAGGWSTIDPASGRTKRKRAPPDPDADRRHRQVPKSALELQQDKENMAAMLGPPELLTRQQMQKRFQRPIKRKKKPKNTSRI
jgi:hypothetical protein